MEIVQATASNADFRGFLALDTDFNRAYDSLAIGSQYERIPTEDIGEDDYRTDFNDMLARPHSRFLFAKEGDTYLGYLFGTVCDLNSGYHTYRIKEAGLIDSLTVAPSAQGRGVSSRLRDAFFDWLKSQKITICQVHVKTKNSRALHIYEHWGFEEDERRLWKALT